ncbi:hypothetical protein [Altererythrobacter sp. Z27]|uniref:hypothetical protein n=1 Tax=Altererythrobacter sp. Z27 TaxID=3461147 RepID=UPI004043FC58
MKHVRPSIPYVQSSSSQDVPPPYHFPDVTVNAFIWPAQVEAVQNYCDTFLNLGTRDERGFEYRPAAAWPYAMLFFLDYPEMISSNREPQDIGECPYPERGITTQREVFVSLPVVRYGNGPLGLIANSDIECVLPFIVVDKPWSCICGREMLGLGKLLAKIEMDEGYYPDSFQSRVRMPGWKTGHPGEYLQEHTFLKVKTGPALPTFRLEKAPEKSLATLFQSPAASLGISTMSDFGNFIDFASAGLFPTAMRSLGLKQYRDAKYPERAIYQALVSCRSQYGNLRDLRLYDEKNVKIRFRDTGSFHQILKVLLKVGPSPSGKKIKAKPIAALRFKADIDYDHMRVVHEFPITGGDGIVGRPAHSDLSARWFRPLKGFFGKRRMP